MSDLKDLKIRINGIKSTQKITRAMRMVAASKLVRARRRIESSNPYINRMQNVITQLASSVVGEQKISPLFDGTGEDKTHLLILVTSDRGLCGGFNSALVRDLIKRANSLINEGKNFKIFCIGKKGYDLLKSKYKENIVAIEIGLSRIKVDILYAESIALDILKLFEKKEFDVAYIIFNRFKSALSQILTCKQIIPVEKDHKKIESNDPVVSLYEFEPSESKILATLLPKNLTMMIYYAMLQSIASEHGARMNSMENATNNAQDMIKRLTVRYNRTRQASITKELIEIISGAEALK